MLCAFLCTISCDKLVNEYYDTPIPQGDLGNPVTGDGDSCTDFGWSPDGSMIVYTDGLSFVKKIDLSSGSITTLSRGNGMGSFEYFSPRITNDAVYFGRRWMDLQTGLLKGAICKAVFPDTSARTLQQFTAPVGINLVVSGDGKMIACASDSAVLVFDTSGMALHKISTNPGYVPFCFSQDNATLYISSNYPFFSGLNSFSLIDSSATSIMSGMANEAGWDVIDDNAGLRVVVKKDNLIILRNITRGDSSILLKLTATNWSFNGSLLPDITCANFSSGLNSLAVALYEAQEAYKDCNCSVDTWRVVSVSASTGQETASYTARKPVTRVSFSPDGRKMAFIAGGRIFVK